MTLTSEAQTAVDSALANMTKLDQIVNGDVNTTVSTTSGPVKSIAKLEHDIANEFLAGMGDIVAGSIPANDSASGTLWTTVQGFINKLLSSLGAGVIGHNPLTSYPANTVGATLATLFGQRSATFSENPTVDGGLVGAVPDGNSTKTYQYRQYNLTGSRTKAKVGECIVVLDDQNGPTSGASTPTPDSASYVLSLVNVRPNWSTTSKTGETDALNLFVRQGAGGDAAGILSNVGAVSGFACTGESFTFDANSSGTPVKAVNLQWGVVNGRDGGEYGLVAQATIGSNLTAAVLALESGSATWEAALKAVRADGSVSAYVRMQDGAFVGGSLVPRVNRGAQIGASSLFYENAYSRAYTLDDTSFAGLPSAASSAGQIRYISNGSAIVGGPVSSGATPMFVASTGGSNWIRMV
jgi:hypothetical protein